MKPQTEIALGNHVCLIQEDSADYLAVVPHAKQSLDSGERCLYVADGPEVRAFVQALASEGVSVKDEYNRGALVFMSLQDYRPPEAFDVEVMSVRVQRLVEQALADGFSGLLLLVDMTWALHPDVSPDVLTQWESIGNDLLSGSSAKAICIYKRSAFSPRCLRDALHTHSLVLVRGQPQPNPYYEPPDIFLDPAAESEKLDWMLSQVSWEQERQRAQEEVRIERERLNLVLETAPVGMLIVDRSGNILLANREIYRILDMSPEMLRTMDDYLGAAVHLRPDGGIVSPEERSIWRVFKNAERILAQEVVYQLPDGRKVPALINKTPIISATGEVLMVILAIQDMSALEESQRARSEFLGVISHEMRNPIAIIKGAASTVSASRELLTPEDTWEMIEIIEEQTDRLRDLVDNLLDINRIEAGTLSIRPELVSLGEVLEEAQADYQRGGGLHSIVVRLPCGDTLVNADRGMLVQVLMNLLSNASKFSEPPQPIAVDVDANATDVTVSIRDQGIGIPRDKLPLLFRKFTRLNSGEVNTPAGTGLGLAICKGLVEAHGGRIWASSPGEGQGATFSFALPAANGKHPPMVPGASHKEPLYGSQGTAADIHNEL